MPATDYQGSSSPFASLGRSILSIKRDQVHSMEPHHELECFQKQVADLFHGLATGGEDLLSLSWIGKLLDAFLICQEKFRVIRWNSNSSEAEGGLNMMSRGPPPPPLDRLIGESFERSVKALDVCNAIRDGIERVRQWQKHLEIVLVALDPSNKRTTATTTLALGEGQLRRAKKALVDLTIAMLDEKGASSVVAHRNRSFGGRNNNNNNNNNNSKDRFRSLSWSVSRSWSAGRQLQAIGNNLAAPRGNEIIATNGLAVPIFTMDSVLLFSMWSLVAAIPCQCRDLQLTHFSIPPRTFPWAPSILLLHERILEESKKKDRRNSNGLLKEIHQIEKCMRHLTDLIDTAQFPLVEERQLEARQRVEDLALLCDALKDGLDPLEHQVREVFRSIVRNRTEGLDCLARGGAQS